MEKKKVSIAIVVAIIVIVAIFIGLMFSQNGKDTYEVTFDVGTSGLNQVLKTDENGNIVKPEDPTKEGYIFEGWYYGDEKFDFTTKITQNMTLTAKWKKVEESKDTEKTVTYTVTFNSDGGSEVKTQTIEEGKTVTKPADPTKEGYTFVGWYYNTKLYNFDAKVTSDVALVAKWQKVEESKDTEKVTKYTVKFDSKGGSTVKSQTVVKNKLATKPSNPTREGYTFVGWYLNDKAFNFSTKITKNITLIAKWNKVEEVVIPTKTYTVTFNTDGGSAVKAQTVEEGKTATKPEDPTKTGHTFKGWYLNGIEFDFTTKIVVDTTLTAKWEAVKPEPAKTYTVTFNTDGGSAVKAQTVEEGKTATRPEDPTKTGHTFKGWYLNDKAFDFSLKVTSSITLVAKWEEDAVIRWEKEPTLSVLGQVDIVVYKNDTKVDAVVDLVMNSKEGVTVKKDVEIPKTGYRANTYKVVDVINIRVK